MNAGDKLGDNFMTYFILVFLSSTAHASGCMYVFRRVCSQNQMIRRGNRTEAEQRKVRVQRSVIFKRSGVTSLWFEPRAKLGVPSVVVVFLKSSMIFEGKSFFSLGISFFTKSFDSFCDCFFIHPFILCPYRRSIFRR